MKKKILLTLILGIFLISFVSAQIQTAGPYTLGDDVPISQHCVTCTFSNFTSLTGPDGNKILSGNFTMAGNSGDWIYNVTSANLSSIGRYIASGFADKDGTNEGWIYDFEITPFGTKVSNSGIVYATLLLIVFGMDILIFFLIFSLRKERNFTNLEGNPIGVSIKKYLRVVLIGVSYGLILLTINLMNAAATTISEISQFAGILGGIYLAMGNAAWIWTISIVIWMGIMIWKDGNLIKEIEKRMEEAHHSLP